MFHEGIITNKKRIEVISVENNHSLSSRTIRRQSLIKIHWNSITHFSRSVFRYFSLYLNSHYTLHLWSKGKTQTHILNTSLKVFLLYLYVYCAVCGGVYDLGIFGEIYIKLLLFDGGKPLSILKH